MKQMTATETAIDIIGSSADDDYILDPASHAGRYQERAPELANALSTSLLQSVANDYSHYDAKAITAQRRYKQVASRANLAVLVAASASALLIATTDKDLIPWIGLIAVIAGALGAMFLHQLNGGNPLKNWMKNRARAESMRLLYFKRITTPGNEPVELTLLRLEYFRRYMVDMQRSFYRVRSEQHAKRAFSTLKFGSVAVFIGSLGAGVATALGTNDVNYWSLFAVLGVIGSAFASFTASRESIGQDSRNAERYDRTAWTLNRISERLDSVRDAVAAGNTEVLLNFVEAFHEQLSVEHREWIEEMDESSETFSKLEKSLAKSQKK